MAINLKSRILFNWLSKLWTANNQTISNVYIIRDKLHLQNHRHIHNIRTNSTVFEITHGVGGSEAMLFADQMFDIYCKYFAYMKWPYRISDLNKHDRSAKVIISSQDSFENLIQEAGVHRVQRVPATEKYGRMHTSTISIAVTPESILDYSLNEKDVEIKTKRSSGPGGQHVNKTESAVRLTHKPSGISIECQETRNQLENKKIGMKKLLEKLRDLELEKLTSQIVTMKKVQIGNANRNEKIRTYNFPQDRITDHRIKKSYHNLKSLFSGDVAILDKIIKDFHT